ncbi:major royal jelly protein 2-like [Agrilus planipennis]|uniref:Major royal jelly protein 2-like n=1 Tax=Agrilus planipennis TaxID=224129 RepID=A0A1W4XGB2_AGRPL|nr:major royal jelly protein 2-like [Agrilus planipennis]
MFFKFILGLLICLIRVDSLCEKELLRSIEWVGGPFDFETSAMKSLLTSSDKYINKNIISSRGQIFEDSAILAFPRFKCGNPATLVKLSLKWKGCTPLLEPFPCWSSQEINNCKSLQSVVDVFIDPLGVCWVLDAGIINTLESSVRTCAPKVVAFNLKTGRQLKSLDPTGLVEKTSRLQYLIVEYTDGGEPYVFVVDASTASILVFDVIHDKSMRVVLPKEAATGCSQKDVLYAAVVQKEDGFNYLLFTYLCGLRMFAIRTDILRSGSLSGNVVDLGLKPGKIVILGTDFGSAIFFRYEGKDEVFRWDSNDHFKKNKFISVYKSKPGFLVSQVMPDIKRQKMRVLESNFPDFLQGTVGCGAVQQINIIGETKS